MSRSIARRVLDVAIIVVAFWSALVLRLEGDVPERLWRAFAVNLLPILVLYVALALLLRTAAERVETAVLAALGMAIVLLLARPVLDPSLPLTVSLAGMGGAMSGLVAVRMLRDV